MRRRRVQSGGTIGTEPTRTWELKSTVIVEGQEWPDDSLGRRHLKITYTLGGESRARNLALTRRRLVYEPVNGLVMRNVHTFVPLMMVSQTTDVSETCTRRATQNCLRVMAGKCM